MHETAPSADYTGIAAAPSKRCLGRCLPLPQPPFPAQDSCAGPHQSETMRWVLYDLLESLPQPRKGLRPHWPYP